MIPGAMGGWRESGEVSWREKVIRELRTYGGQWRREMNI